MNSFIPLKIKMGLCPDFNFQSITYLQILNGTFGAI